MAVFAAALGYSSLGGTFFIDSESIRYIAITIAPILGVLFTIITLNRNTKNNRRNTFDSKFNLLLEQHHIQLKNVVSFIDENKNNDKVLPMITNGVDYSILNNYLFQHSIFSPYMRVLFHILKSIHSDFRAIENSIESEKKYSSLVRSLIRNDILYLIAINTTSDKNADFELYRKLLVRYDFFEHINITGVLHSEYFNYKLPEFDNILNLISKDIDLHIENLMKYLLVYRNSLFENLFSESIRYIKQNEFKIKTPPEYRFYYFFKKKTYCEKNEKIKKLIRESFNKKNIEQIAEKIKQPYKKRYKYFYIGSLALNRSSYIYSNVINKKIYFSNEIRKIKANRESIKDFEKRLQNENNITKEILFSSIPENTTSSSYHLSLNDYYSYAIKYEASKVLCFEFDDIYHEIVEIMTRDLNLQNILTEQNDEFSMH